jgi:hypothetical protein
VTAGKYLVIPGATIELQMALHSLEHREQCAALLKAADYTVYDPKGQTVDGVPSIDEIYFMPGR